MNGDERLLPIMELRPIVAGVLEHASQEFGYREDSTGIFELVADYIMRTQGLDFKGADNFGRPMAWYLTQRFFEPPITTVGSKPSVYVRKGNGALSSMSKDPSVLESNVCVVLHEYGETLFSRLHSCREIQ